ncbi:protein of unknown function [Chryseobacterium sp. JV274]|nr:protein of unknown function [Chryseobacterium sp. JV274]
MNGQQRKEMFDFYKECIVEIIYTNKISKYFRIIFREYTYNICLSNHFGEYRKGYRQYITKKLTHSNAKHYAYQLHNLQKAEKHL